MTALVATQRIGSQRPRLHSCPPFFSSLGQDKIDLAEFAGLTLDPWQKYVIEETSGLDRRGKYAALEVGVIVPRQNGKGGIIEADQLGAMFLTKDPQIIYSAHQFKTAKAMYRRIKELVETTPDLNKLVKAYRQSNEETGIELPWGRLNFFARSNGSGRGFSGKKLYFDEAYNLDPELIADMLPTLSAMDSPQVWYLSSAGMAASEQLARVRARGIQGDSRLAFYEWSVPSGADLDSVDALYEANPAMGIRLDPEFVSSVERPSMNDEQYGRERLGIWADPGGERVITAAQWAAVQDPESRRAVDDAIFAVNVDIDQATAAISVATENADGKIHVELVDMRPGTDWAIERLIDIYQRRKSPVVIDAVGPSGALIPVLQSRGVELRIVGTAHVLRGCAAFVEDVRTGKIVVPGGRPELDSAVAAGAKRPVGDAWAWKRKDSMTPISPLTSATLAHYGWLTRPDETPKPPSKLYAF